MRGAQSSFTGKYEIICALHLVGSALNYLKQNETYMFYNFCYRIWSLLKTAFSTFLVLFAGTSKKEKKKQNKC